MQKRETDRVVTNTSILNFWIDRHRRATSSEIWAPEISDIPVQVAPESPYDTAKQRWPWAMRSLLFKKAEIAEILQQLAALYPSS